MVNNRIAEDQNAEVLESIDHRANFASRGAGGQFLATRTHTFRNVTKVSIQQASGTENNRPDVANLPAVGMHLSQVVVDISCNIVRRVFILAALAIYVRLHETDRLHRSSVGN